MLKKVEQYIKQYHMIERGDRIVLGVSGGADSVSLFVVMLELREKYNIEMVVVHVNHGIRGEDAKRDEEYVKELCRKYGVNFECVCENVKELARKEKLSEEEMGRKVRYEAFSRIAKQYGCNKIAVAHNQNDVSETVLLNLFRGSGLKGLAGIEPVRGNLIRPLLCVQRREIEAFLKERNWQYHDDVTNFETDYTRNKVRLRILPYAEKEINERASEHIAKSAVILSEANGFIEEEADKLYKCVVEKERDAQSILLKPFQEAHSILRREVVRRVLFSVAGKRKDIEMAHVEMILELVEKGAGKKADLPYGIEAIHQYDKIVVKKKTKKPEENHPGVEVVIPGIVKVPGTKIQISCEVIAVTEEYRANLEKVCFQKKNDYTKWFDYDKIRNTVFARYRKTGDFFICNSQGNKKKLKDYLIDQKVPANKRDSILLLADGNHIMWAVGLRISEHYKISCQTTRVLKVKVDGGNEHE